MVSFLMLGRFGPRRRHRRGASERERELGRRGGVGAMTCRPDGVDAAVRESTHRVREPRQSRDGIDPHRLVESYGAQPPVELLRQFLDFKGFYDRDKLFWKDITDTMLFTGAAPPGGGRSVVTPRFTRHYNVFCVPPASEAVMKVIFESIFSGFMKPFDKDVQRLVGAYLGVL